MDTVVAPIVQKILTVIVYPILEVVFAAALFLFVWGLVQFLYSLSKGGGTEQGRQHMLWGVIGMFIMVSANGIIAFIRNTLGV